ncbi:hypothetical protein EKH79_13135 [Dyella dinghuensis]|uniref:Sugar transporter n=1 Tax=Dyella dinghuensis TaxID=1920169 RepID=A0A3S0PE89_9GAMM|nr:lipoprotein [Dyella dinghuensis]RUL63331.1 hypothetical protein EKH79_13135 [Dyella dinghuensis]
MRRSILLLPACLALSALAGCGNKGPLYYPPAAPKPAPVHKPAPAPIPAPAHSSTSEAPASASSVVTKPLGGN